MNRPPSWFVRRHTSSLASVHGVRTPMKKFFETLPMRRPIAASSTPISPKITPAGGVVPAISACSKTK